MVDERFPYTFTVFTATYNRAHTLPRVYESLKQQTYRDFEWLIVDDESTDDTRQTVESWQAEAELPIRYVVQRHGGKHVAFNTGVREAAGRLFLTLDSDDGCVPTALERFKYLWDSIADAERPGFSAVTVLAQDEDGALMGTRFPRDITDSDALESYFVHRVWGEKWGFQRTDILRQHPYPEPKGVGMVPEALVWFAIARTYKTRYVNESLRIYHQTRPRSDALSALSVATARGRLMFHQAVIEDYSDYMTRSPSLFMRSLVNYSRYSWLCGRGPLEQLRRIRTIKGRLLVAPFLPVAGLFAVQDRHRM